MEHIRQKLSIEGRATEAYTVVITDDWALPLAEHPSIVNHPDLFEISTDEIPENHQFLNYSE
jgi:hypothetical protein